jgi:hypothetical protein
MFINAVYENSADDEIFDSEIEFYNIPDKRVLDMFAEAYGEDE